MMCCMLHVGRLATQTCGCDGLGNKCMTRERVPVAVVDKIECTYRLDLSMMIVKRCLQDVTKIHSFGQIVVIFG